MLGLGLTLPARRSAGAEPGPDPFTPGDLFTAGRTGFWLNPKDPTTRWQDAEATIPAIEVGDRVYLLQDQSGGGNDTTQADEFARPTVSGSGELALGYDGTRDYLDTNKTRIGNTGLFCDGSETFTLAGVFRVIPQEGGHTVIARGAGTGTERTFHLTVNSESGLTTRVRGASSTIQAGVMDGESHLFVIRWNGTDLEASVDGNTPSTLNVGTVAEQVDQRILIGAQGSPPEDDPGNYMNGEIGELILLDAALSQAEIDDLKQYLTNRHLG